MDVFLLIAAVFGLCFLVDKLTVKLFRSKPQHRSGKSVRQNKRYGSMGLVLTVIGIASMATSAGNKTMLIGGVILILMGCAMGVYYLSSGIYYDEESFLVESLGKKGLTYRYDEIVHQQLYLLQGGGTIVELHMADGTAVQVVSSMPDYDQFLNHAFRCWCRQKGIDPESCQFHDTANSCWFPEKEKV